MQKYKSNITTTSGAAVRGVPVLVIKEDGNNAALFLDRAGTVPAPNPLTTGADGTFYFYAINGRYSLRTTVEGVTIADDDVVLMMDPEEITVAGPIAEAVAAAQAAATEAELTVANSGIPVLVADAQNAVADANNAVSLSTTAANNAAISKADADSARDAAVVAKNAAEAALDSFDDRYLGAKAVAPTTDNDGGALLTGALYWDTALSGMRSWNGTEWVTLPAATKASVGLSNVDNTADTDKPVSTAQQTALDLKANLASPTLTGTPTAPTAAAGTSTTQIATTAFVNEEIASLNAAAISNTPAGSITATTVQGAINELAEIKIDLADATDPAKGAALVGFQQFSSSTTRTVQDKLRDTIGPQDFGGTDTAAFAAALAVVGSAPRELDLAGDTVTLTAVPTPQYGAKVVNGKVIVPSRISGKTTQWNTYADETNGIMVGRENLAAFMLLLSLGVHNVHMFGDSTIESGPWALKSDDLFQRALMSAGINDSTVHNHGAGGTSWSDLAAIPYLDPAHADNGGNPTRLIVIKYGINDGVKENPLATLMADARAKLTAIRADARGGASQVSILLLGPNSTYNPSSNLDAKWYEDLRRCYVQLAREFDCAYLDLYAYMQDTKNAPGVWMDDFTGSGFPGEGLHPEQVAAYWYYHEAIKTFVLGDGSWSPVKANHFWNTTPDTREPLTATTPAAYPLGMHLELADPAFATWPETGVAHTVIQANGQACQKIHVTDTILPRTLSRHGADMTWGPWTNKLTSLTSALLNSWVNHGAGWEDVGYVLGDDGWITLYGTVKNGTINSDILTLPYAPAVPSEHSVPGATSITITLAGTLSHAGAANTRVCITGVRYRPAAAW